jgi:hypothetical protein
MRSTEPTGERKVRQDDRRSGTAPLPLAAASERLRGVPGFPRARGRPRTVVEPSADERQDRPAIPTDVAPRLLDVNAAGRYLGVSPWTIRDLDAAGTLKRVRIPLRDSELRKLLFDRTDLDRLIEAWKS